MSKLVPLQATDPVFRADRASHRDDHIVDSCVECGPFREERLGVRAFRCLEVLVQVAVSDMAEADRSTQRLLCGAQP